MRQTSPRALLTILLTLALTAFGAGAIPHARAAECGDGIGPCQCGDKVVTDTKLGGTDPVLRTTCPCDGLIVTSRVTLDIGGTLRGQDDTCSGIVLEGNTTGVVVKNGKITGFGAGVNGDSPGGLVTGNRVANLDITASFAGVLLRGSANVVENNTVRDAFEGVLILGDENTVRLNRAERTVLTGVAVIGDGNTISRNIASRNRGDGIAVRGETVLLELNRAEHNDGAGFILEGATLTVIRNVATSNAANGFAVGASASTLDRNRSDRNGRFGIEDTGISNTYLNNRCTGNHDGASSPPDLCR